jgi:protocatechuate 3,4-dioxygenase beta subunit
MGSTICLDSKGDPMLIKGRVVGIGGAPISGVKIDVWQTNDDGFYDVQQKGIQPDLNLCSVFRTGEDGAYYFWGAKPQFYPIPNDGPVGQLLSKQRRPPYRPAHLHYILEAEGFETLITHIYDPDDDTIHSDAVFGVKESLLAKFELIEHEDRIAAEGAAGPFYEVVRDFVLAPAS